MSDTTATVTTANITITAADAVLVVHRLIILTVHRLVVQRLAVLTV